MSSLSRRPRCRDAQRTRDLDRCQAMPGRGSTIRSRRLDGPKPAPARQSPVMIRQPLLISALLPGRRATIDAPADDPTCPRGRAPEGIHGRLSLAGAMTQPATMAPASSHQTLGRPTCSSSSPSQSVSTRIAAPANHGRYDVRAPDAKIDIVTSTAKPQGAVQRDRLVMPLWSITISMFSGFPGESGRVEASSPPERLGSTGCLCGHRLRGSFKLATP